MARIELTPGAELLEFPISTDKFVIYKRNGNHYLRAKVDVDYNNLREFIYSVEQTIHERITAAGGKIF